MRILPQKPLDPKGWRFNFSFICLSGSHPGIGGKSRVDGQYHASDCGGGLVVAQEKHAAQQLLALHVAAHGGAAQNLGGAGGGGAVLVEQQLPVLIGHQEPRGNGVATDAGAREVGGQPLGEVADGGLGPGVSGDLGQWDIGVHGADVEDHTAFALHHVLGEGLGGQQSALEVQLEHKVHAPRVQVEEALLALGPLVLVLVVGGGLGAVPPPRR